jgi:hypothetical protein
LGHGACCMRGPSSESDRGLEIHNSRSPYACSVSHTACIMYIANVLVDSRRLYYSPIALIQIYCTSTLLSDQKPVEKTASIRSISRTNSITLTVLKLQQQKTQHRKRCVQQLFYCCVRNRYCGNIFTEPLRSNVKWIHMWTHRLMGGIY